MLATTGLCRRRARGRRPRTCRRKTGTAEVAAYRQTRRAQRHAPDPRRQPADALPALARSPLYQQARPRSYNTDSKVRETIELAEASGINYAFRQRHAFRNDDTRRPRKNGGKIQTILYCTSNIEDAAHYREDLQKVADFGSEAVYLWGEQADKCSARKKWP